MVKKQIKETQRSKNNQVIRPNIYISCEGDAEEAYLKGLKKEYKSIANIKINKSRDTDCKGIVRNLKTKFANEYSKEDLKYCIFDCDENSQKNLNDAHKMAKKLNAHIIFSNPCFEIWLLWHFENDLSYQGSREKLKRKIEKLIEENYWQLKNEPTLYDFVKDKLTSAQTNYEHRKKVLEQENIAPYSKKSNPYTNIDDLISKLIELKHKAL